MYVQWRASCGFPITEAPHVLPPALSTNFDVCTCAAMPVIDRFVLVVPIKAEMEVEVTRVRAPARPRPRSPAPPFGQTINPQHSFVLSRSHDMSGLQSSTRPPPALHGSYRIRGERTRENACDLLVIVIDRSEIERPPCPITRTTDGPELVHRQVITAPSSHKEYTLRSNP